MGLTTNDSHLRDMCATAERGQRRQDIIRPGLCSPTARTDFPGQLQNVSRTSFRGNPRLPGIQASR